MLSDTETYRGLRDEQIALIEQLNEVELALRDNHDKVDGMIWADDSMRSGYLSGVATAIALVQGRIIKAEQVRDRWDDRMNETLLEESNYG